VLVTGVGAISEVLRPLDHRFERGRERSAAARLQQSHPRCFNEPLKVFQRRADGTAVPVLLLRALSATNRS